MVVIRALMISFVLSSLAAAADWSTDITLVKDMVVLDKAYIPALLIAGEGDVLRAQTAADRLTESWAAFQSKWKSTVNQEWQSGFERIDQIVAESASLTATAQDLKHAYVLLDEIRHIFARLREEADIPYFVDFVTSVEDALQDVIRTVAQDNDKPMTPDELDAAEKGILLAQQRWNVVADTRIDKTVYRIDIYYMGDLSWTRSDGVLLLEELTREVRTLDRAALTEKVDQLLGKVQHFLEILGSTPGA